MKITPIQIEYYEPGYDPDSSDEVQEVCLLTAFPDFAPTLLNFDNDDMVVISQANEDNENGNDVVMLSRDMVLEMMGVLNTYVRATAE